MNEPSLDNHPTLRLHAEEPLPATYGPQMQQAWRDQLMPDRAPLEFDPDEPF